MLKMAIHTHVHTHVCAYMHMCMYTCTPLLSSLTYNTSAYTLSIKIYKIYERCVDIGFFSVFIEKHPDMYRFK